MNWILPHGASTFAPEIDWLYYLILVITGVAFVIVEVALIWFMIQYRARPGRKAHYTHGNNTAEIVWTAVPAVTVVALGILSGPVWNKIKGRHSVPADAMPVAVKASQFEWNVTYPGPDAELETADDFTVRNQLHVVVNRPTVVVLTAEDVIHSFFVPSFRVKQDAVPGMGIRVWFQPTETGRFELACAELCGLGHYRMRAFVTVHTEDDYRQWLAEQTQPAVEQ